ncbi:MAG: hypothetical protein ACMUEM_05600 [Flavobacteriales bacterium AspAUS03]
MNKYIKLLFTGLIFLGAIYAFKHRESGWGIFLFFLSMIPLALFFRNEFLIMAFVRLCKKDLDGVKKWLGYIKNPKSQLIKSQDAYYYFLNGLLASNTSIYQSEHYMRKALELGLKFKQNQALAKLHIAVAAGSKGRKREAEKLLTEVKKLDKAGLLEDHVKMIREQLKRVNIGHNLANSHVR